MILNLVVIRCANIELRAAFYGQLGLLFLRHQHGSGPEHLSAEAGGVVLELYPMREEAAPTTGTRLSFRVAALNEVVKGLMEVFRDAVVTGPADSEWGRRAVVKDPDGHRVELVEGL